MTLATPVRAGVSLDELLAAKERRAARQADMLEHYQQPVISLTLVTPGEIKDSLRYRNTMGVALQRAFSSRSCETAVCRVNARYRVGQHSRISAQC